VPPSAAAVSRATIERSLGKPVGELFESFEAEPMAAASLAQVHAATLKDGRDVVVKVLRPGMRERIERDIECLYALASLAQRYWPEARRLRPVEVVQEYEKTILDELDLLREAANMSQVRRNFDRSAIVYVPEVHWDLCRRDVMVMERVRGVPVSDVARLRELGINIQRLAENGVTIFFTQVFRHNFFHADMHPGNIFVDVADPANPRWLAVDYGIVGSLDPRDQHYMAANFLAFFDHDYRRVAVLHIESGWVPATTRVDELESAVRTVCEPIFNKPLGEISFGTVLLRVFEVARRFDMHVQPQLILLQKTLLNIEGLGRQLYPELDLWKTAQPILRQWMRERVGPEAFAESMREHWPDLAEALKALPVIAQRVVRAAYEDRLVFRTESPDVSALREEIRRGQARRSAMMAAAAFFLGGVFWTALASEPAWIGWVLLAGGAGGLLARLRD
jgi:ubiquinone biosynthesis protein